MINDVNDSLSNTPSFKRLVDLYNDVPKAKDYMMFVIRLETIVKVTKAFHERDTVQS